MLMSRLLQPKVNGEFDLLCDVFRDEIAIPTSEGGRAVLVEGLLRTPKNTAEKLLIAKCLCDRFGLSVVVLLKHAKKNTNRNFALFRSAGVKEFISLEECYFNLFVLLKAVAWAVGALFRNRSAGDILSISVNGVYLGDLIYDSIIRENEKVFTVDRLYFWRDFLLLIRVVCYVKYYQKVFKDRQYSYAVTSHKGYLKYGALCKVAKLKCCDVILKDMNLFKFYGQSEPIERHIMTPKSMDVEKNLTSKNFLRQADEYIQKRLAGSAENMDVDVVRAYQDKRSYTKEQLLDINNLPRRSKVVLVMPHAFSDSPHVGEGMSFFDYHHWLVETLKAIGRNRAVVGFVKPHPTSYCWGEEGAVESIISRMKISNVFVLPADFNTKSFSDLADLVVTCQGTIALEATCLGVPALISADGYFGGFDICTKINSREGYTAYLESVNWPLPVPKNKCKLAKVVLLTEVLSRVHSSLVPFDDILPVDDYYTAEMVVVGGILERSRAYSFEADPLVKRIYAELEANA